MTRDFVSKRDCVHIHAGIRQKYIMKSFSFICIIKKCFQSLSWSVAPHFSLPNSISLRYFYAHRVKRSLCSDVYNLAELIINVDGWKEKKTSMISIETFSFFNFNFCCSYKNTIATVWHQPHMSKRSRNTFTLFTVIFAAAAILAINFWTDNVDFSTKLDRAANMDWWKDLDGTFLKTRMDVSCK